MLKLNHNKFIIFLILFGKNHFDANCMLQGSSWRSSEWRFSVLFLQEVDSSISGWHKYEIIYLSLVEAYELTSLTSPPRTISWSSVRINTTFGGFSAALETAIEQQEYKARNTVKCFCWRNILLYEKCVPSMLFSWNILHRSHVKVSCSVVFRQALRGTEEECVTFTHATIGSVTWHYPDYQPAPELYHSCNLAKQRNKKTEECIFSHYSITGPPW